MAPTPNPSSLCTSTNEWRYNRLAFCLVAYNVRVNTIRTVVDDPSGERTGAVVEHRDAAGAGMPGTPGRLVGFVGGVMSEQLGQLPLFAPEGVTARMSAPAGHSIRVVLSGQPHGETRGPILHWLVKPARQPALSRQLGQHHHGRERDGRRPKTAQPPQSTPCPPFRRRRRPTAGRRPPRNGRTGGWDGSPWRTPTARG